MEQTLAIVQLMSTFNALEWLNGLAPISVTQWMLVAACWWVIIGIGMTGAGADFRIINVVNGPLEPW
jgi:hypothetical protein